MKAKKIVKVGLIVFVVGALAAGAIVIYLFNKPHRDVQNTDIDFKSNASDLVAEYLSDPTKANEKYLDEEGNSKIMAVTGKVHSVTKDMNNQFVVLLKEESDKAGVSCTFSAATNSSAEKISVGQMITIKGVIRSGAGYDADLDLYEDVVIEKSDVITEN
ncbi:MAG: hypothetical protein JSS73_14685 [Bacteroidetes bacterium]|nr:hypothetical protein [Bacteroidota bacterium]